MSATASDNPAGGRDDHRLMASALDVAELVGSWVHTEPNPSSIARASIEWAGGALRIRTVGADPDDRGDATADSLYAASPSGREAVAFTSAYEGPGGAVGLHANVSKGLLILSSFRRNPEGAGHPSMFAREFFRRGPFEVGPGGARSAPRPSSCGVGDPSTSIFRGAWRNTQRRPALLASLTFSAASDPLTLRADGLGAGDGSGPCTFEAALLADGTETAGPSKVRGGFRLGNRDVAFHGWVKQEVLVLAYFVRFPDGDDRSDYFDREFFYRER